MIKYLIIKNINNKIAEKQQLYNIDFIYFKENIVDKKSKKIKYISKIKKGIGYEDNFTYPHSLWTLSGKSLHEIYIKLKFNQIKF